jgi:hypothetical protein
MLTVWAMLCNLHMLEQVLEINLFNFKQACHLLNF